MGKRERREGEEKGEEGSREKRRWEKENEERERPRERGVVAENDEKKKKKNFQCNGYTQSQIKANFYIIDKKNS